VSAVILFGRGSRSMRYTTDVDLFSRSTPEHVRLHVCILAALRQAGGGVGAAGE
jgi:hypothetical protein